jgi:hypothetical protein
VNIEHGHHLTFQRRDEQTTACLHLWAEVLRVAFSEAAGPGTRPGSAAFARRESARIWIRDDETRTGSFLWICSLFGLDPEVVRARLDAVLCPAEQRGRMPK